MINRCACSALFLALLFSSCGRNHTIKTIDIGSEASFRGMSIVDDDVAWISGSAGTVARTTDGGGHWSVENVEGYDSVEFRSIYAFDENIAVIGNAGSPAHILRTEDGGTSWDVVYTNADTSAFIDGVDFWDTDNGMMYGDPIGGRMLLIRTSDGGRTWTDVPEKSRPRLAKDEYSFAASGTGIRCYGDQQLIIATGGAVSRLWRSEDMGISWNPLPTPIIQGEATTGIFSFTILNEEYIIIVGGDYLRDTLTVDHVFTSRDGGLDWIAPKSPTMGYRECVEVIGGNTLIATGPTGTDISYDGGEHWSVLSDEPGFHVARHARNGSLVLLAGGRGSLARLE